MKPEIVDFPDVYFHCDKIQTVIETKHREINCSYELIESNSWTAAFIFWT